MWICKKCAEKIEDQFDTCWSCGTEKSGAGLDGKKQKNTWVQKSGSQKSKSIRKDIKNELSVQHQEKNPALTICKDCGGRVSKKADVCPSCGAKLGQGKKLFAELFGGIASLIVLGVIALVFIGMFSGGTQKTEDELKKALIDRCNEAAKSAPQGIDKKSFFASCVQGGLVQLKNQGQIK